MSPWRPAGPCTVSGCPSLAVEQGRCRAHAAERQRRYSQVRPTSAERGYSYAWQQARVAFLVEYPVCFVCGAAATLVDHILPLRLGGADVPENYQALCRRCHGKKTWRERRR